MKELTPTKLRWIHILTDEICDNIRFINMEWTPEKRNVLCFLTVAVSRGDTLEEVRLFIAYFMETFPILDDDAGVRFFGDWRSNLYIEAPSGGEKFKVMTTNSLDKFDDEVEINFAVEEIEKLVAEMTQFGPKAWYQQHFPQPDDDPPMTKKFRDKNALPNGHVGEKRPKAVTSAPEPEQKRQRPLYYTFDGDTLLLKCVVCGGIRGYGGTLGCTCPL